MTEAIRRTAAAGDGTPQLGFSARVARREGGGSVITVIGELDLHSAATLQDSLDEAIDAGGEVELDMRTCSFVDSMGIATLVGAARRLGEDGRILRVRGARERVRGILELAGVVSQRWVELE